MVVAEASGAEVIEALFLLEFIGHNQINFNIVNHNLENRQIDLK